jgi:hypothetical protein
MKKRTTILGILVIALSASTILMAISQNDSYKFMQFTKIVRGKGLVIWGYGGAQPPFPGEDFFVGGSDAPDEDGWYASGWYGEPEYFTTITDSRFKLQGKSEVVQEVPLRPDIPGATKIWAPPSVVGEGLLRVEWTHESTQYSLDVIVSTEHSPYTWVGSPGNTDWRFFGTGGPIPNPELAFICYQFSGEINDEEITGYLNTYSWPDALFVNIYIAESSDESLEDTIAEFIWLSDHKLYSANSYGTHYWLVNWLWFDVGLENLSLDLTDLWIPQADKFYRRILVI